MRLRSRFPFHSGFTLVEVLVALFVVGLGIAGAAGLQTLAVRAARDAARLADGTRLASSLGERMRANPVAAARPDDANPYLQVDYDADSGVPATPVSCYADTACDPDDLARFDLFELSSALAISFPGGRILTCRDAASPDATGLSAWACDGRTGAPVVVKIGWRAQGDTATGAPKVMLALAGAAP
ncbi:type IV pilus modification protein PilV [Massilia pinisoli]|uniref:Type IV pilus modification protein PilV n=1 Tax=Massilia pinisoli TaxID=1772194 RepID=A0ABT1ZUW4_9BURK|nr:type IV pilus modification protein PilV [Massilia pinisoli]MCS0583664.1 type IV pilus modification protein PilV [Massilia pinisoli]